MRPQFDFCQPSPLLDGAEPVLVCPRCGSNYLGHGDVEVFNRTFIPG